MRRVRIWENGELPVGFRGCCEWLVVNEAVLLDPFFSQVFGSQSTGRLLVLLKRRSGRPTGRQGRQAAGGSSLFSRKMDWVVQVIPHHAIKDKGHKA
jgi:hypothetical protein